MAGEYRKDQLFDGAAYQLIDSQLIPLLMPSATSERWREIGAMERGSVIRVSVLDRDDAFLWIQYSDDKLSVVDDLAEASIFEGAGDAEAFVDELIKRDKAFDWKAICQGETDGYMVESFERAAMEVAGACFERLLFDGAAGFKTRRIVMP